MTEEDFRGWVHATVGTLLAVCAAYNAMRLCETTRRRNLANLLIYAPLVIFEWHQVKSHWSHRDRA